MYLVTVTTSQTRVIPIEASSAEEAREEVWNMPHEELLEADCTSIDFERQVTKAEDLEC